MKNNTSRPFSTIAAAAAAFLIGATLAGCSAAPAAAEADDGVAPIAVTTVAASHTDVATPIEAGGVVQPRTGAVLAARLLAPVLEVRAVPGDRVRKGQTLVVLEGTDLAAAARATRSAATAAEQAARAAAAEMQAAEAALALARISHDRIAGLHERGSATAQELDEATAALRNGEAHVDGSSARSRQATSALESARAVSDQAETTASFTTIVAPFDGTVTEKMVEPGNMATPGAPLLRVEGTGGFRLEVRVDESRIADIRPGDSVQVLLAKGMVVVESQVVEVSRAVDADARAFLVKVGLPASEGLRSGEFGKARFTGTLRRVLSVPASAIVRRGQLASVFVVDNGRARLRLVNVSGAEVLAGLAEGEPVIVSPPPGLVDGRRVTVGGR